jgi:hypothetical protein
VLGWRWRYLSGKTALVLALGDQLPALHVRRGAD